MPHLEEMGGMDYTMVVCAILGSTKKLAAWLLGQDMMNEMRWEALGRGSLGND